jgi:molybdate transport system substrate-binding protein
MAPSARVRALLAVVALIVLAAACTGGDDGAVADDGGPLSGTVTVLAASSLTDVLDAVGTVFEAAHQGVTVDVSYDGSARLAAQVLEGAPADVLLAADEPTMSRLVEAGRTSGDVVTVATNRLQIVVARGNPLGIGGLADLAAGGTARTVALCRPSVPCGAYAAQAFARAGLPVPQATEEDSVRAVLTKVQLGEADAGVVYATDVRSTTAVTGIDLPADVQVQAAYPASVLADAPNPRAAAAFVAFLLSHEAQLVFADQGFGAP